MSKKRQPLFLIATALTTLPCAIHAAGLVEDAHARLEMRNIYFNQDNRSGAANPSKQEEWGQGSCLILPPDIRMVLLVLVSMPWVCWECGSTRERDTLQPAKH
uniref:Outer membrane porin n=1 Tax=Ectopseudomonas oleovorans TaxID=301 RepID=A0A653BD88_ECTOL